MASVQSAAVALEVSADLCNFQTHFYLIVFIDLIASGTENSAPKAGFLHFFCAFFSTHPEILSISLFYMKY